MSEVLVLVDHVDGVVRKTTTELLTIAAGVGEPSAVFVGTGFESAKDVLARFGAAKVYLIESPDVTDHLVAPTAEALAQLVERSSPAAVLIASNAEGKEIAARLAIKIRSGLITDAVEVADDLSTTQSVFAGTYTVRARVTMGTPIITVKPNSATPLESAGAAVVEVFEPDISELATLSGAEALAFSRYGQVLMSRIERLGKPVIARINGFALGGGMELAMACHLRIAADNAKFGQPEINLGVLPGFGGTQRLLRLTGRNAALELCLLGENIGAARALELGLVTRVVAADRPARQDAGGVLSPRLRHQELQFADLVARQFEAREVVSLHPEVESGPRADA